MTFLRSTLTLGALVLPVAAPAAEMTCAQLGTYLATLAPTITPFTAPGATTPLPLTQLLPAAGANAARCEANFIYSNRGGPAFGYAVGQNQRIGIRVGTDRPWRCWVAGHACVTGKGRAT